MKLIIAVTGASGANLSLKFIDNLPQEIDAYVVFSKSAKLALKLENNMKVSDLKNKNVTIFNDKTISAPIASGSFGADAMIILPCSQNTLAKCAVGISDSLITRAFSVMLKEKKNIILAPREMPYSTIFLENMHKLSGLGVTIAPPVLAYYSKQENLQEMETFLIGKWYDLLNIKNNLYERWNG
ncbi:MAG: UbiX family flavin prenyltransferase [Campylobacteraceae bacterium]|nr:UbiX family flavin prenyltransferase [Campylobacteraceae bacterium]